MSRLVCPECGEPVERGTPRGGQLTGWAGGCEPRRREHRHVGDREPLCPVMTSKGYQPALPKRSR